MLSLKTYWLFILLVIILIGCESQSTPIASISTPTDIPEATQIAMRNLRYGVTGNLASYLSNLDTINFEVLDSTSEVDDFDLIIAYGIYDGWQQAPQSHHISLAINPNLAPLDNPTLRDLMPQMVDTQMLIEAINVDGVQQTRTQSPESVGVIRTILANEGYPDGLQLILATNSLFAIDDFVRQFALRSVDLRLIDIDDSASTFTDNRAHLALFFWTQDSERDRWTSQVDDDFVIDLLTIPISYFTPNDISVDFTENGIPIPSQ